MALIAHRPTPMLIDLVQRLGGRWHGYTAMCRCPAHDDRTPSLSLRQGDRRVLVTCFAGCTPQAVLRGLPGGTASVHFAPSGSIYRPSAAHVSRLWDQAMPVPGTLAARYLRSRWLSEALADVRYHPRCPIGPRPQTVFRPALLVAVREGRDLVAVQRCVLDRHAACTGKLMLGRPGRGAWQGAQAGGTLAVAEGCESAAAFTILTGLPCWASLGARRLDQLRIPPRVQEIVLAEDADFEGTRAAAHALLRYRADGLVVRRCPPPRPHKDWADILTAGRDGSSLHLR